MRASGLVRPRSQGRTEWYAGRGQGRCVDVPTPDEGAHWATAVMASSPGYRAKRMVIGRTRNTTGVNSHL